MTAELPTRRTVLTSGAAAAGVAVSALALAACGPSDSGSKPASDTPAAAPKSGQPLAKLADIPVGQSAAAKTSDGKDVLVSRPTATTAACFSSVCTHEGCAVKPDGAELRCPCHGSVFDALTGAVKKGPAPTPLDKIAVKVVNGQIVTA
jgi:Rieske Fe-S protein